MDAVRVLLANAPNNLSPDQPEHYVAVPTMLLRDVKNHLAAYDDQKERLRERAEKLRAKITTVPPPGVDSSSPAT